MSAVVMQVQISAIGRGQTIENHLLWIVELFSSVLGPNWRYTSIWTSNSRTPTSSQRSTNLDVYIIVHQTTMFHPDSQHGLYSLYKVTASQ